MARSSPQRRSPPRRPNSTFGSMIASGGVACSTIASRSLRPNGVRSPLIRRTCSMPSTRRLEQAIARSRAASFCGGITASSRSTVTMSGRRRAPSAKRSGRVAGTNRRLRRGWIVLVSLMRSAPCASCARHYSTKRTACQPGRALNRRPAAARRASPPARRDPPRPPAGRRQRPSGSAGRRRDTAARPSARRSARAASRGRGRRRARGRRRSRAGARAPPAGRNVAIADQQACLADHVFAAGARGGHDRHAGAHRLEQTHGKFLRRRRQHEDAAAAIELGQRRGIVVEPAMEHDVDRQPGGAPLELAAIRPVADHLEPRAGAETGQRREQMLQAPCARADARRTARRGGCRSSPRSRSAAGRSHSGSPRCEPPSAASAADRAARATARRSSPRLPPPGARAGAADDARGRTGRGCSPGRRSHAR